MVVARKRREVPETARDPVYDIDEEVEILPEDTGRHNHHTHSHLHKQPESANEKETKIRCAHRNNERYHGSAVSAGHLEGLNKLLDFPHFDVPVSVVQLPRSTVVGSAVCHIDCVIDVMLRCVMVG